MKRILVLMTTTMSFAVLVIGGVAYALTVQCDGAGDQAPDPVLCAGTNEDDKITGTTQRDNISALDGLDDVNARPGDDTVNGGNDRDEISGGAGGDGLHGGRGPDTIDGGPGTPDSSEPLNSFSCTRSEASVEGNQILFGEGGNDILTGGRVTDLLRGGPGTNDLSGNGGGDCLFLFGDENEQASGGEGDDIFFVEDGNGDDIFCGAGHDTVDADANDRVAANCEDVFRPTSLRAGGATPEAEVTITTPEGTITMTP
jgi:Ca2+-binding RTX toxin-like protein